MMSFFILFFFYFFACLFSFNCWNRGFCCRRCRCCRAQTQLGFLIFCRRFAFSIANDTGDGRCNEERIWQLCDGTDGDWEKSHLRLIAMNKFFAKRFATNGYAMTLLLFILFAFKRTHRSYTHSTIQDAVFLSRHSMAQHNSIIWHEYECWWADLQIYLLQRTVSWAVDGWFTLKIITISFGLVATMLSISNGRRAPKTIIISEACSRRKGQIHQIHLCGHPMLIAASLPWVW